MTHDLVERLREIKRGSADVRVVAGRAKLIVPYGNLINEAADKLEAYMAEIAALRAALEPFAQAANGFDRAPKQTGSRRPLGVPDKFHILKGLTVGDLRRARDQFKEHTDGK